MANEFTARNGIIAKNNSIITGSLNVTQGITGSLFGTASVATSASYALSASQAQTASYVLNAVSASFSTLAQTSNTASYVVTAQTASYVLNAVSSSLAQTASFVTTAQTASYVVTAQTASYVLNAVSASIATSAGTAQTAVTSSYADQIKIYSAGGTNAYFTSVGEYSLGHQQLNALSSVYYNLEGDVLSAPSFFASAGGFTGNLIGTADSATNATNATSASYALTASYAMNAAGAGAAFPYTGDARISGSLTVTGSASTQVPLRILSGSNTLLYVSASGNTGIGTATPAHTLDVNGTTRVVGVLTLNSSVTQTTSNTIVNVQQLVAIAANTTALQTYRMTNAGATVTPKIVAGALSGTGANKVHYDETNQLTFGVISNNARDVTRAAIQVSGSNNASGSEAGDLLFLTQTGGTAASEKMRITGAGGITYTATNTAAGTTGNQTINRPSGTVNIAAAGTTVTVTNSLVTTSSIVFATIRTNDSTAIIKNVVPAAGSFTINLNAATTAETSVGFFVIN